tara:strand:- start:118 stop:312 length:195 start_codon:yes stop_codon:yes gene_type:complete
VDIYEKRGKWRYTDAEGKLHKFNTEEEALESLGFNDVCDDCDCDPCECEEEYYDGDEEEEGDEE